MAKTIPRFTLFFMKIRHYNFSSDSASPKIPEGLKISTKTRIEKAITSFN